MSIKEIKAKIKMTLEEALVNGNLDALDEVYSRDAINHTPPTPDIKGLEAIKQVMQSIQQGFSDIRFDIKEIIGENNTIALRYTMHMKHTGTYSILQLPPTGKEVVIEGCIFFHLKSGKVIEEFEYDDLLGFLQQLGIIPTMGPK